MSLTYSPHGDNPLGPRHDDDRPLRPLPPRHEMNWLDAVAVLRSKQLLILICVVCGLLLGLIATWLTPKRYSSTVTIQIQKENGSAINLQDLTGVTSPFLGEDALSVDLLTQQLIIANENTALRVMQNLSLENREPFASLQRTAGADHSSTALEDDPEFRDRAVQLFQSRLRVSLVKGTRLINITYTDRDPHQAAQVANAVVDAYVIETAQQHYDATSRTSSWLTNQMADLKAKVSESQRQVNDFRAKNGLLGTSTLVGNQRDGSTSVGYDNLELDRLADLNRQLTSAEAARISDEAIYHLVLSQNPDILLGLQSSQLSGGSNGANLSSSGQDIGILKDLREKQGQLKLELASGMTKYGTRNPIVVQIRSQLSELDAQISQEMQRLTDQAKNEYELAAATESSIRRSVDAEKAKIAQLNNSVDQLLLLEQEEEANRSLYEDLYSKLEAANVLASAKSSDVTIVNPARVPAKPSRPQPIENIGLGMLAGLTFGLFGAFASNHRNDTIRNSDDVARIFGFPLLGVIPLVRRTAPKSTRGTTGTEIKAGPPGQLTAWVLHSPKSATAEAYRQIRTAILLSRSTRPPQTILFASSVSGEGKTTSCYNTGFAFALQGSRVLLIDGDMRRPSLHTQLGLPNDDGLSHCLSSDLDPASLIHHHPELPNVSVLTAGPVPPMPSELLGSPKFTQLVKSLQSEYDFIFIDAPPILMVTDAVLIARSTDAAVLVIRAGVTRRAAVRRVLETLGPTRNKLLGVILNAVDLRSPDYNSAYGYYGDNSYYVDGDQ